MSNLLRATIFGELARVPLTSEGCRYTPAPVERKIRRSPASLAPQALTAAGPQAGAAGARPLLEAEERSRRLVAVVLREAERAHARLRGADLRASGIQRALK